MTRIIAGRAGSRQLAVPKSGTRPTSDRVREAIFSGLEARDLIAGARVLDLYAGSGALGLEAASRGAVEVRLVERNAPAAAVCRRNAEVVRSAFTAPPRIDVSAVAVAAYLAGAIGDWDLVFLDPPYELPDAELTQNLAALTGHLAEGATVLVERSTRSGEPAWPEGITPDRHRDYGDTTLWWATAS